MSDLISRTAFKNKYLCFGYLPEMSEKEFDRFPTVDAVEVVHGEWIDGFDTDGVLIDYDCSVCNMANDEKSDYCPNCGARMDNEESE